MHHLCASRLRGSGNVPRGIVRTLAEIAERDLLLAYAGTSAESATLVARYSDGELAVILDFMTRAIAMTTVQIARLRAETARQDIPKPAN